MLSAANFWVVLQGITVLLGTLSLEAIGLMRVRNKSGHTLVNPKFCSTDMIYLSDWKHSFSQIAPTSFSEFCIVSTLGKDFF